MAAPGSISFSSMSRQAMSPGSTKPSPKSAPPPANSASSAATLRHPDNVRGEKAFLRCKRKRPALPPAFFPLLPELSLPHSSAVAALWVAHPSGHAVLHPAQTPSQPLGQLLSRTPQPGLQGVFRDAEFLGCFACRIALHFAPDKRCPQQRPKLVQILAD